jgi:hypothetical protein
MISHEKWFRNMKDLRTLGFEKTNDDIVHHITQVGKLFMQNEHTKYFKDVFHVQTITKNLILVG